MLGISGPRRDVIPEYATPASLGGGPVEHRWSPYNDNGGTTVAVAGQDYALIASDTRLTDGGYGILSRTTPKLFQLTDNMVLGATGCWADVLTLTRLVSARIQMYKYSHNQTMNLLGAAQMLSNVLYSKRFFPYSVSNVLAGLDENGEGWVYSYDPVGCVEKLKNSSGGAGVAIIQPLLDNQVEKLNMSLSEEEKKRPIKLEEAETLVHDAFIAAAERQIHVADAINFKIITKDGIHEKTVALRRD